MKRCFPKLSKIRALECNKLNFNRGYFIKLSEMSVVNSATIEKTLVLDYWLLVTWKI